MSYNTPRGTRDFIGKEMKLRRKIIETIREVYRLSGFEEAQTPAFENFNVLSAKGSAGEEIQDEIYYFKDKSNRELGLRFDFTVPLARMVSSNPALPKPFKRFQIGKVWRYDRPGKGRYREFTQADADILGVKSMDAEAECLSIVYNVMARLGIKDYRIRVNSRKIAEGIVLEAGIEEEKVEEVFRSMDKLEKIGREDVAEELEEKGISHQKIEAIMKLINIEGSNEEVLKRIKSKLNNDVGKEGMEDIKKVIQLAEKYEILDKVYLDLSIVRGLEYYTGFIFETEVGKEDVGSVCSGGRYDNLIELYGGEKTPAVGISFGVDRLYDVLEDEKEENRDGVFIGLVDKDLKNEGIGIAQRLRNENIKTQLNLSDRNLGNQISYADSKGFKKLLIVGERDLKEGKVTVKDLETGEEEKIDLESIEDCLKEK